ncbi:MAG TPA: YncE family protein [Chryseolinea sp.]|nr:YncE family protein [Chryseolinea sp.]
MNQSALRRIFAILGSQKVNLTRLLAINFLFAGLASSMNGIAQSGHHPMLLALSKTDHTLAIVNSVTLKVIAKVPVGPDPHEVIASTDGKMAYVANTGGGRSYEINVIDLVAQKALPNIDTRPLIGPHGIHFAVGKVWFSAEGAKAVGRFDPATGKLDWCIGTGQERTHMVYVTADGKQVYTTNVNAGSVSILADTLLSAPPAPGAQPRRDWIQTLIPVSKGSEGFDVTPDGRQLWTVSADDGKIAVIDLTTKKLVSTIDARALGANRLKFTPDGKLALISSLRTGDLLILDVKSTKELKRISLGKGAAGILVDKDGSRAFVGCTADNYVAVIDLKKLEVIGHIDVGAGPDGLAWAGEN